MAHVSVPTNQDPRPLSWGLKRLTSGGFLNDTNWQDYTYDSRACGQGVTVYIADSPVRMTHTEFAAETPQNDTPVSRVRELQGLQEPDNEGHRSSHGTFVAGVAAGKTCGVAKGANIVWVQFDSNHYLASVKRTILDDRAGRTVLNISTACNPHDSPETTDSLVELIRAGIHVVIAAGNTHEPIPASWKEPAAQGEVNGHLKSVIWVGGSEQGDTKWFSGFGYNFASSFGPIVDLFAPGHNIRSATDSGNDSYRNYPGTSFAAPHVTGIIACLLSHPDYRDLSPRDMKEKILAMAEQAAMTDVSVDHLLRTGRTRSSYVKPILGRSLDSVISQKRDRLTNNKKFKAEFKREAEKMMDADYVQTELIPLLGPIQDSFDGSEPEFLQVCRDVREKIRDTLNMTQLRLRVDYTLRWSKNNVAFKLCTVIMKNRERFRMNKFNLREKFRAKASEMVKSDYIDQHLLPQLDEGIQNIGNGSATFDQVGRSVKDKVDNTLEDGHIEEQKVFTTTRKLASCRLERWGEGD